jgi:hypothetical protein
MGASNTSGSAYADIPASVTAPLTLFTAQDLIFFAFGYGLTSGASGPYSPLSDCLAYFLGDVTVAPDVR